MAAQERLEFARIAALLRSEQLEEVRHGHRVVPGAGHDLRSEPVRLVFVVAAEFEEGHVQSDAAHRVQDLRRVAALLSEQPPEDPEARLGEIGL